MGYRKAITGAAFAATAAAGFILSVGSPALAHSQYQEYGGCVGQVSSGHTTLWINDVSANNKGCSVEWYKDSTHYGSKGDANGSADGMGEVTPGYSLTGALWRVCEAGTGCHAYQTIS